MKLMLYPKLIILALAALLLHNTSFAQHPTTNVLSENINDKRGNKLDASQTKKTYPVAYSGNLNVYNNDGGDLTDYALLADGLSIIPADNIWCDKTARISAAEIFDASAYYTSPQGIAACTYTSTYSEKFTGPGSDGDAGSFNMTVTGTNNGVAGSENYGDYTTLSLGGIHISNDADACCTNGATLWKSSSSTGNDGGGLTDYALLIDANSSATTPNPASLWCYQINVSPGDVFEFYASYTSPWAESAPTNNPAMYLTIDGVTIGSSGAVVTQWSGSASPYYQEGCNYTIPSGTSGAVKFCINMVQYSGTSPGKNGQGNDILIDDIIIKKATGCTPTTGCTYTGATVPVELLSFNAKKESGNTASLKWTTASERNSSYYSIEKSEDGQNFSEIGTVKAQGNSSSLVNYEYNDYYFHGTSYYRLKMVDIDGSYKYSSIILLKNNDANASAVRLGEGKLGIKALADEDTQWNIAVYSLLGQEYINETISIKKGENSFVKEIIGGESAKILRITALDGSVILSDVMVW